MGKNGERTAANRGLQQIKKQFLFLGAGWSVLLICAAAYSYYYTTQTDVHLATLQAKTAFAKDIVYRRWNASKGGLYVPVSKVTPPNPYLAVANRDISSDEIGRMTLVNPSYMTRQVHQLERLELGVRSHITSLNPIRPANQADPWETKALLDFEKGQPEIFSLEDVDGAPFLRYMKPLMVEIACLRCHEEQGYNVGDIRGGISVSVPMLPIWQLRKTNTVRSGIIFVVIWLSGLTGIVIAYGRTSEHMIREERAFKEKEELGVRLLQAKKMEAVGHMAAGVAHEINTPVQYLGANLQFVQESFVEVSDFMQKISDNVKDGSGVPTEISKDLEAIDWEYLAEEIPLSLKQSADGLDHISGIVQAMKVFSHPGSEQKERVDLNEIISNVITISQNEWKYVADLSSTLSTDLPKVPVFVDEMRQVFLNIITNAIHAVANEQKGEEREDKGEITISSMEKGENVEVRISDTGSGIEKNDIDHIFDLFFTTKEVGSGTGQGLYLCYDIVTNKHGGELLVDSEVGVGTTFIIRLPQKTDD